MDEFRNKHVIVQTNATFTTEGLCALFTLESIIVKNSHGTHFIPMHEILAVTIRP